MLHLYWAVNAGAGSLRALLLNPAQEEGNMLMAEHDQQEPAAGGREEGRALQSAMQQEPQVKSATIKTGRLRRTV